MGEYAWVTLATNDSYSLGALVLAHSIRAVGSRYDLAVLVTPGVTPAMRQKLEAVFNLVQEVNILDSRDESNLRLLQRPELGVTFTKLHCWRLTQYFKCVFLDADTLMLQNSDELFHREEFSAAPDVGWPDCFNSGVFVYRPCQNTYDRLIKFALEKGSFDGGDQGLLNLFFDDWARHDIHFHLPFIYNMCSTACYSYLPAFKQFGKDAKIVHFIGPQKPWLQYFNTETKQVQPSADATHLREILQRWWDIFCSLIHPQLSPEMAGLAGAFAQLTLGVPRTPEQDALENALRKQAWEVGNIDYLGKDSFENIWSKISETLGASQPSAEPTVSLSEPGSTPVAPAAKSAVATPASELAAGTPASEPSAATPVEDPVQSAPPQEEAKPIESLVATTEAPSDTTSTEASKADSTESSQEKIVSPSSEPTAVSTTADAPTAAALSEPQVVEKEGSSSADAAVTGDKSAEALKEPEGAKQEVKAPVCPIPEEKETKEGETKTSEPQAVVSEGESKTPEAKTEVSAPETKAETAAVPATEVKSDEPVTEVTEKPKATTKDVEPQTKESESKGVEPEQPKDTVITEPGCALPEKKEATAEVAKEPAPQQEEAKSEALSQKEASKETPPDQEAAKVPSEEPPVVPQAEATPKESSSAVTKEPETLAQTAEAAGQPATSPEKPKDVPSPTPQPVPTTPSPKEYTKSPKEVPAVAEKAGASADTAKSSKGSPKTKVTEATPPTTPGSPLVEKTKEALAAETAIPDTPPPTEGASTPTPPPRKTDKPKKAAAKPKK